LASVKSVEEHVGDILGTVGPLPARRVPLEQAHGCLLAADIRATAAVPRFDNSAMDGYAVRASDVAAAGEGDPVTLPVAGVIPAGARRLPDVAPGTAVMIMTGAPFPSGADTIVQVEWTDGGTDAVTVRRPARRGLHIRRAGEDVTPGQLVLAAGTQLDAARISLLAAVNVARPPVHPRPRVAVVSTGDELVDVGSQPGPGQIVDSNGYAIAAAVQEAGARVRRVRTSADDPAAFAAVLADAVADADAVVTTGGVSVGAYDVVKQVLAERGDVRFARLAMQPGKPQGFGLVDGVPVFTLPGNPVSALVSFELFVRPALRRMRGLDDVLRPPVAVRTGEPFASPPDKRSYLRVRLSSGVGGGLVAHSAGGQGSHQLSALASADALMIVPENVTEVPAGATLAALILGEGAPPTRPAPAPAGRAAGPRSRPADAAGVTAATDPTGVTGATDPTGATELTDRSDRGLRRPGTGGESILSSRRGGGGAV
jgi:molybdopterin molybdotransferase